MKIRIGYNVVKNGENPTVRAKQLGLDPDRLPMGTLVTIELRLDGLRSTAVSGFLRSDGRIYLSSWPASLPRPALRAEDREPYEATGATLRYPFLKEDA